jgi:hypothetical protein
MCFSATASFTGAAVVGVVGVATLKNIDKKSQIMFALIPILFALQQFSEGIVWLNITPEDKHSVLSSSAQYIFLLFAFVIWPFWIPASILLIESVKWRQFVITLFLVCGIFVAGYHLSFFPYYQPDVKVVGHSIQYVGSLASYKWLYGISVILPSIFSSYKNMWFFGVLIAIALISTNYFYEYAFVSTWCFFSALLSTYIFKVLYNYKNEFSTKPKKFANQK